MFPPSPSASPSPSGPADSSGSSDASGPSGPSGLSGPAGSAASAGTGAVICSAKGCRAPAVWVLAWNNPKLHTPERRKTWLACDEHREYLGKFLGARGFLKDTVPLEEWEREHGSDG